MENEKALQPNRSNKKFKKVVIIYCLLVFGLILLWTIISFVLVQPTQLTILHTDALYGQIKESVAKEGPLEGQLVGGSAMLSTQIKRIREEVKREGGFVLLLDAGSALFGASPESYYSQGKWVIEIMNKLNYDAMTLGNRDFDYGPTTTFSRIKEAKFPILGCNVFSKSNKEIIPLIHPYVIKDLGDLKIGILGVVDPILHQVCLPKNLEGIEILPYEKLVRKSLDEMKAQDVNFVIVLSHLYSLDEEKNFIHKFGKEIDLIVGRSRGDKIVKRPYYFEGIPIVKTSRKGQTLGRFDFLINPSFKKENFIKSIKKEWANTKILDQSWKLYPIVSSNLMPDLEMGNLIKEQFLGLDRILKKPIAINVEDMPYVSEKESAFGNLISDIVRDYLKTDVVFLNSGNLRGLSKGMITTANFVASIPFDDSLVTMKLLGKEIKEVLEISFDQIGHIGILQESGIQLIYDLSQPLGEKIKEISILGEPIDLEKEYLVGTSNFLAVGGDGLLPFKGGRDIIHHARLRNVVLEYFERNTRIHGKIDGRMAEETP